MENNLRFLDFITDSHYTSKSILSFRNESQTYYEPYLPIKYTLDSNEQDHFLSSLVHYLFATLEFVTDKSCNLIDLTDRFIFCPAGSDSIDSSASLGNLNQQRLCHLLTASGVDEQPADSINMRIKPFHGTELKWDSSLLSAFHWPRYYHMYTPICKGIWEIQSS